MLCPPTLYGHGDLHKRIKEVSAEIKKDPDNLSLYLKRGKLYLEHEEYDNSLKDLARLRDANYEDKIWHIYAARCYNALAEYENALNSVTHYLDTDSLNVRALRLRGHIFYGYECFDMATESYEMVLRHSIKTLPENYLECASAYMISDQMDKLNSATRVLNQGINQMGNIPVLYERLVNIHLKHGDIDDAIRYQTRIVDMMNRKENALYRRAEMWMSAGDVDAAKADYMKASDAINALPQRIKNNRATIDLMTNINNKLNLL